MQSLLLLNTVESMIAAVKGVGWVGQSEWGSVSKNSWVTMSSIEEYWAVLRNIQGGLSSIEKHSKVLLSSIEKYSEILLSSIEKYCGGRVGTITRLLIISRQAKESHQTPSQVPQPNCFWKWVGATVYTMVISLWGNPAPKFVLEPLKRNFIGFLYVSGSPNLSFIKFQPPMSPLATISSRPQKQVGRGTWLAEPDTTLNFRSWA